MDAEAIKIALQATNMMGTFALGVWLYIERRGDKTNERVDELGSKVDAIDKDLTDIKAVIRLSPTHTDLSKIHEKINSVSVAINTLSGEFSGLKNVLNLIHEHLLNEDHK